MSLNESHLWLQLRPATMDDAKRVFDWRNDPFIVARGSQQRPVSKEEHFQWFTHFLQSQNCRMYIILLDDEPGGQIRFEQLDKPSALVSLYLLKQFTGHGFGVTALRQACWDTFASTPVECISAFIREDNDQSLRAFQKAGFISLGDNRPGAPDNRLTVTMSRPAAVPHNRLTFGDPEIQAAAETVRSGQWACGPKVARLEQEIVTLTGVKYALAVASGLSALRIALRELGVQPGKKVFVPAYSCVALANAVLACGGSPVPIDVTDNDWNLDMRDAEKMLATEHPCAIIAVNTFGAPAAVETLNSWGFPVIEDCAHGFGVKINGRMLGARTVVAALSFYATKLIGAGEGGMILTNAADLAEKAREARDYSDRPPDGARLNEKMTDLEAALALCQLDRLDEMIAKRSALAQRYHQQLDTSGYTGSRFLLPAMTPDRVWYRYAVRLAEIPAIDMIRHMQRFDIHAAEPVTDWRPLGSRPCPVADRAYRHLVSLPLYPTLTEVEQDRVIHAFLAFWQTSSH